MRWVVWLSFAVAVVALVAWYLSYTAARLDRLHARVTGSVSSLDAQLLRRAEVVGELAGAGVLDSASSLLLADAATASMEAAELAEMGAEEIRTDGIGLQRAQVESDLTSTLLAVLAPEVVSDLRADEHGRELCARLHSAGQRVQIARRFHNEAVREVRRLRARPQVRLLGLAGHTELPAAVTFDDRLPDGV